MNVVIILGISKFLKGGSRTNITNRSHAYSRLMKGYDVYNQINSENKFIICSGGFGQSKLMKNFLVDKGIPEYKIVEEGNSRTTIENCVYSYDYLSKLSNSSGYYNGETLFFTKDFIIHLVTNDYHIERSEYIFNYFKYRLNPELKIIPHSSSILSYIPHYNNEDANEVEIARKNDIENLKNTPSRLKKLRDANL